MKIPAPKMKPSITNTNASQMSSQVNVVSQMSEADLAHLDNATLPPITIDDDIAVASVSASELEQAAAAEHINIKQRKQNTDAVKEETHGVVESARIPVNQLAPEDIDDILSSSIIARPLMLPDFLNQRAIDPNYRLRWVNFKANSGARYAQMKAAGFRNAKAEEVVGLNETLAMEDGAIKYNDTILMIVPAAILLGAYKYNFLRSRLKASSEGAHSQALGEAEQFMSRFANKEHVPGEYLKDKVSFYKPGEKETSNI